MKEVTYYIAEDGKEFYDEDECRDYEMSLLDTSLYKMYDIHGEKVASIKDCWYLVIPTEKARLVFNTLSEYNGYCATVDEVGNYIWNDDYCKWFPAEKRITALERELNMLYGMFGKEN